MPLEKPDHIPLRTDIEECYPLRLLITRIACAIRILRLKGIDLLGRRLHDDTGYCISTDFLKERRHVLFMIAFRRDHAVHRALVAEKLRERSCIDTGHTRDIVLLQKILNRIFRPEVTRHRA